MAKLIDLIVSGKSAFANDINAKTIYSTRLYMSGAISTCNTGGTWVSGMTNAAIRYNDNAAISSSSYHPFLSMKAYGGHVVNFGGLENTIGFYGYYNGRTANSYDWSFTVNSSTGKWTMSNSITASAFITSGGANTQVVRGDGTLQTISSLSVSHASTAGNADTVDNKHASDFATSGHTHPYLPLAGGTMNANSTITLPNSSKIIHQTNTGSNYVTDCVWYLGTSAASEGYDAQIGWHNTGDSSGAIVLLPYKTTTAPWENSVGMYISKTNLKFNGKKIWREDNDGSGSGLDADTTDGLHVHSGRNNEANKIVRTDGSGYIQCGYINSSSGNEGNNSSPARVWGTNGSDNYMRTYLTSALSVKYSTSAGNADTLDSFHSNRFTFVYNSTNYNNSSSLTLNQMAADGNSNSHVGMIYAGTDNPVSSSGNWVHVWSQSWSRGSISSWCSQIALGVQQGTGMWYRTTSGALAGRAWNRVLDSANYTSYVNNYYWANVKISTSSNSATYPTFGSLAVINDSCNNSNDSLAYFQHRSDNDWTVKIDSGSYDYGLLINGSQTGTNALTVNGASRFTNTIRIGNGYTALDGNYCEGIRIRAADNTWATIILGATADTGTNTYAWSIHRTSGNNFSISRNSSDGANGLLIDTSGRVGIGTTSPSERLSVNGWVGTIGNTGWYSITYAGGIYMTDSTWVRVYNNKKFYVNNSDYNAIHSAGGVYVAGMIHSYANYLKSTCNGAYVQIGPQNSSHVHYVTDATVSHWFNKTVQVDGNIEPYGNNEHSAGSTSYRFSNVYSYSGNFAGTITSSSYHQIYNSGSYTKPSGNVTGAIVIQLPITSSQYDMINVEIAVYEYNSQAASKIIVGGHPWQGKWYNYSCSVIGGYSREIRLGIYGGKWSIILGTSSTVWSYPGVFVTHIGTVYDAYSSAYASQCTLSLVTSESGFSALFTPTNVLKATHSAYASSAGNADTVDGQHFNWNNNKNDHTYLWAASSNGQAYLVHRASMSVNYANSSGSTGKLTSLGNYVYSNLSTDIPTNAVSYKIITSGGTDLGDSQYNVLHIPWSSGDYGTYLLFGANNGRFGVKYKHSGAVREVLDSDNYTNYAARSSHGHSEYVLKTGDTMSGTLYFSQNKGGHISADSAGLYMQCGSYWIRVNHSGSPEFTGQTMWHSGNDGSGSGLDADTLDSFHANRFTVVYNSANYNDNSSLTVNQMAADGNSNSHVGMIYAGTDNPVSSSGNWVHVWSQTWARGTISSWCSQIALGVQQGTGMWYRTTSGALAGRVWTRVIDSANIGSQSVSYASSSPAAANYGGQGDTTKIKIKINSATSWMLSFVVTIYQGYKSSKVMVSGYNYGSYYWYQPEAVLLGDSNGATSIPVYFGYDSAYNLWVGFDGGSYTGVSISDVTNGYTQISSYKGLFTISNVSSLSTLQTTITATNSVNYAVSAGNADTVDSQHFNWNNNKNDHTYLWAASSNGQAYLVHRASMSVNYANSAGSASSATIASTVTVNNSDSNSTYRMVWHSGNTLYGTGGIYCNPSTDTLYASAFYESSDIRLKQNIKQVLTSNDIPQIKEFDWKNTGKHSYGLIAQELESMGYSELVDTKDDGYKSVNYTAALCLIIGKLQLKIKELEDKIKSSSI